MKVTTTSGATYLIDHGICKKYSAAGELIDTFKVYGIKPYNVPTTVGEIWELPNGKPEVGMCMFIWGREASWHTTPVVSIEGEQK